MRELTAERRGFDAERRGVADVERRALVELGVALRRGIAAQAAQPLEPGTAFRERSGKMRRMRAIEHVVGGRLARGGVDLGDRLTERLAGRQLPVRPSRR